MARRKKNSAAAVAGAAVVGAVAGAYAGHTLAVPDIEAKLDQANLLIDEGEHRKASALLIEALDSVDMLQSRLGGSPTELRKRMVKINAKLPLREQVFSLEQPKAANPMSEQSRARMLRRNIRNMESEIRDLSKQHGSARRMRKKEEAQELAEQLRELEELLADKKEELEGLEARLENPGNPPETRKLKSKLLR